MRTTKERIPEVHFYEWSVFRWATSQAHDELDATGRGIYREMIDTCYAQGAVSCDPEILCRKCACTPEQLEIYLPKIQRHFYQDKHDPARLKNKLADLYRKKYFTFVRKQRANAKKRQDSVPEKAKGDNDLHGGGSPKPIAVGVPTREEKRREEKRREEKPLLPLCQTPFRNSVRFQEFWHRYPHKVNQQLAQQMWLSVVTPENEHLAFTCLERYEQSDEWARGVYQQPQNWLQDRARNNWADEPALVKKETRKTALQEALDKA